MAGRGARAPCSARPSGSFPGVLGRPDPPQRAALTTVPWATACRSPVGVRAPRGGRRARGACWSPISPGMAPVPWAASRRACPRGTPTTRPQVSQVISAPGGCSAQAGTGAAVSDSPDSSFGLSLGPWPVCGEQDQPPCSSLGWGLFSTLLPAGWAWVERIQPSPCRACVAALGTWLGLGLGPPGRGGHFPDGLPSGPSLPLWGWLLEFSRSLLL